VDRREMRLIEYGIRQILRIAAAAAQGKPSRRKGAPITFRLFLRTPGDKPAVECAVGRRKRPIFKSDSGFANAWYAVAQFNEQVGGAINREELDAAAAALEELFELLAGAGGCIGVDPSASSAMEVSCTEKGFVVRVHFPNTNFKPEGTNPNAEEALAEVLEAIEDRCSPVQAGA
jgi:hypothetical protein